MNIGGNNRPCDIPSLKTDESSLRSSFFEWNLCQGVHRFLTVQACCTGSAAVAKVIMQRSNLIATYHCMQDVDAHQLPGSNCRL